jgi:hypothetical protein
VSLKIGDLVSYQGSGAKWLGIVKKIIPGTAHRVVVCWIDPYEGKLDHSSINAGDPRFKIEARIDVQSR